MTFKKTFPEKSTNLQTFISTHLGGAKDLIAHLFYPLYFSVEKKMTLVYNNKASIYKQLRWLLFEPPRMHVFQGSY